MSQQPYAPPVAPYQPPPNNYPQSSGYNTNFQTPPKSFPNQPWNGPQNGPRPSFGRQQRGSSGFKREFSNSSSQHSQLQPSQQYQQPQQLQNQRQSVDYNSGGPHQSQQSQLTPQTPVSNHDNRQLAPTQSQQVSPAKPESKAGSVRSTPQLVDESTIVVEAAIEHAEMKQDLSASGVSKEGDKEQEEKPEEGEIGPEDDEEEEFQWDLQHAFEAINPNETVALAQPLSASFKSTPVPLIQAWSTKVPSISRYARKDNLNEYTRTIRSSPQWSYLQEDPAFAESALEGELISFDDVPAWMAARHGMTSSDDNQNEGEGGWQNSLKHPRDDAEEEVRDDQENIDDQIAHEVAEESELDAPRTKRQKQEDSEQLVDEAMEEARSIGTPGTMVVIPGARGGTPCLANVVEDAWAPEPGERATSPPDPTEALLASLGVSGDAKPVKQTELPPYVGSAEENLSPRTGPASQTPVGSQPSTSFTPANIQQNNGPPMNQGYPMTNGPPSSQGQATNNGLSISGPPMSGPPINVQPMNGPQISGPPMNQGPPMNGPQLNNGFPQNGPQNSYGPPINTGYGTGLPIQQQTYQNGPPMNGPYPPNNQFGPPANGAYGNGPPVNVSYAQPPYGPPPNIPYTNGPPNNYVQGPPQYGPPRNPSYGNATSYNGPPQGYNQFGPPAPYNTVPPQNVPYSQPTYGPPVNQAYGTAPPVNYQQGPQYGPPRNTSYGNAQQMPGSYGPNTQMSPTQYGPPQNQQYPTNAYPNQQQYSNGPAPQFGVVPQGSPQYPSGPPQLALSNVANNNYPPRQDSGYGSARGSYSNSAGPNGFNGQNGAPQQGQQGLNGFQQGPDGFSSQNSAAQQDQQPQQGPNGFNQGSPSDNNQTEPGPAPSQENNPPQQVIQANAQQVAGEGTPTEGAEKDAEGKKKRKKKDTTLTDLEKELLGELESAPTRRNPSRKAASKKPQPVVDEAYRYV